MRTGFAAVIFGLMVSFSASAAPFDNFTTHTAAVPEQSFKLAATWFLPDWQAGMSNRSETAPSGSGDRQDLNCTLYGGCTGVPANMDCAESFTAGGSSCYKSCTCKAGFNPIDNADVCRGCSDPCDSVTAVAAPYGCQTYWPVCPSKCQVAYDNNCLNRTAVPAPYGCKRYFSDCAEKCEEAYPDNCHNQTAVAAPYGCEKTFDDCASKCETAYADNCRNYPSKPLVSSCANGCAQGKTYADCTSRCSVGCKVSCDTGYKLSSDQLSCVADNCPSGYEAGKTCGVGYTLEKSGQSGSQYCGKCVVKPCAAGTTSCDEGLTGEMNGYYSGEQACYTCSALTCEDTGCQQGLVCENKQCVLPQCVRTLKEQLSRQYNNVYVLGDNLDSIAAVGNDSALILNYEFMGEYGLQLEDLNGKYGVDVYGDCGEFILYGSLSDTGGMRFYNFEIADISFYANGDTVYLVNIKGGMFSRVTAALSGVIIAIQNQTLYLDELNLGEGAYLTVMNDEYIDENGNIATYRDCVSVGRVIFDNAESAVFSLGNFMDCFTTDMILAQSTTDADSELYIGSGSGINGTADLQLKIDQASLLVNNDGTFFPHSIYLRGSPNNSLVINNGDDSVFSTMFDIPSHGEDGFPSICFESTSGNGPVFEMTKGRNVSYDFLGYGVDQCRVDNVYTLPYGDCMWYGQTDSFPAGCPAKIH